MTNTIIDFDAAEEYDPFVALPVEEKSGTSEGAVLGWEHRKNHGRTAEPVKFIGNPEILEQEPPAASIHAVTRDDLGHGQRITGMPPYAVWQKPTFKEWRENITDDEQHSIERYVGTYYMDINTRLRGLPTPQFAALSDAAANEYIGDMDAVISKVRTKEDIVVLRGVSNAGSAFEKRMTPGAIFRDNAFTSTTIDPITAHSFSAESGDQGPILSIRIPKGSPVIPGSNAESEIILDRGSRFKVLSYNPATKLGELELLPKSVEKAVRDVSREARDSSGKWTVAGSTNRAAVGTKLDREALWGKDKPPAPVEVQISAEANKIIGRMGLTPHEFAQIYTGGIDRIGFGTYPLKMHITGSSDGNELVVSGRIDLKDASDDDHTELVKFERSWSRDHSRDPWIVNHDRLEVNPSIQGSGYGSEMFYKSEDAYRKLGVASIKTDANIDVGGYAWARMGFDFEYADIGRQNVRNSIETAFVELQRERYQGKKLNWQLDDKIADEVVPIRDALLEMRYPFQFAAFSVKYNGKTVDLGRMGMATSKCAWEGVKELKKTNSPPHKAGEAYKKKKLATMKSKAEDYAVGGIEAHFDIYSRDDAAWMAELREQDNSLFADLDMGVPEAKSDYEEGKHPRDESGKWTSGSGGGKTETTVKEFDSDDGIPFSMVKSWQESTGDLRTQAWHKHNENAEDGIDDDFDKAMNSLGSQSSALNSAQHSEMATVMGIVNSSGRLQAVVKLDDLERTDENRDRDGSTWYMHWMATAPWNNHYITNMLGTKPEDTDAARKLGVAVAKKALEYNLDVGFSPASEDVERLYRILGAVHRPHTPREKQMYTDDYLGKMQKWQMPMLWSRAAMKTFVERHDKSLANDVFDHPVIAVSYEEAEKSEVGDKEGHKFRGNQYTKVKGQEEQQLPTSEQVTQAMIDEGRRTRKVEGIDYHEDLPDDEELPDDDENHGEEPDEDIDEEVEQDSDEDTEREDEYEEENEDNYNNPEDRALADAVIDLPHEQVDVTSNAESRELIRKYFGRDSTVKQLAKVFTGGQDLLREKLPEGAKLETNFSASVGTDDNDKTVLQIGCSISYSLPNRRSVEVASFERSFNREYGDLYVSHDLFKVASEFRGTGYGSEMFYQSEDAYKKMGVSEIRVHANIDVGGYAWARMGFAFNDPESDAKEVRRLISSKFSEEIESRLDDADRDDDYPSGWPQEVRDAYSKVLDDLEGLEHPYEFAAYRVNYKGNDLALGHDAMASSICDWHGTKSLNEYDERSPNIRAGEEYKKIKTGKKGKGKKKLNETIKGADPDRVPEEPNKEPAAAVPADDTPPGGLLGTRNGIIGRPESTRAPGYDDEVVEGIDGRLYQYDHDADGWTIIDFESTMEDPDGRLVGRPVSGDRPQTVRRDIRGYLRRYNWNTNKWGDPDDPDAIASEEGRTVHKSAAKQRNGIEAHYDVDSPDDLAWIERLKEVGLLGKPQEKSDTVADFDAEYPVPRNATEILSMQSGKFRFRRKKKKREDKSGTREGALKGWEKRERAHKDTESLFKPFASGDEGNAWLTSLIPQDAEPDELHAADHYKWTSFFNINRILRGGEGVEPTDYYDDEIEALDRYVARSKTDRDVVSYRTLDALGDGEGLRRFAEQLEGSKGKTFVDKAFVSTSVHNRGKYFETSSDITMEIRIPKGTPGVPLDQFMSPSDPDAPGRREGEWLLGRGTRFMIHSTKRDPETKRLHVVLEVVPNER